MNRRSFLSWLGVSPVSLSAPLPALSAAPAPLALPLFFIVMAESDARPEAILENRAAERATAQALRVLS